MGRRKTTLISASLVAAASLGGTLGLGGFTFAYARGASYFTDDPAACANCHVMRAYYDAWQKSSHRATAVCNDCHTPEGFFAKYLVKAKNGYRHAMAFTVGDFPERLRIAPANRDVTEDSCRKCHAAMVAAIDGQPERLSCIRCHPSVGHLQ